MTSKTPNLHVSKNLNISKTKQDIEKDSSGNVVLMRFKLDSTIFRRRDTFTTLFLYDCRCLPHIFLSNPKNGCESPNEIIYIKKESYKSEMQPRNKWRKLSDEREFHKINNYILERMLRH